MIDIKELRKDKRPQSSTIVHALIDRLEAAEKERDALRNEIACVKEVEFPRKAQAVADAWKGKCKRLEAKIKVMERQEPVAWQTRTRPAWNDGTWGPWRKCSEEYAEDIKKTPLLHDWLYEARALYTLPGAQPSSSVPEDWKLVPIVSTEEMDNAGSEHCDGYLSTAQVVWDAMLAAAPEAKS